MADESIYDLVIRNGWVITMDADEYTLCICRYRS